MLISFIRTAKTFVDDTPATRAYFTSSTRSERITAYQTSQGLSASKRTSTTNAPSAPAKDVVVVSGIDLSEYLQAESNETVMERFMREDSAIQRFASSPWVGRTGKL
jgi:hypothetical protein